MPAHEMYVSHMSVHCHGPLLLLQQAGDALDYTLREIDFEKKDHLAEPFRAVNPKHCVPTLRDGDFVLWESNAVMRHLTRAHESLRKFYNNDTPQERARCDMALDWRQTCLMRWLAQTVYWKLGFVPGPKEMYDEGIDALVRPRDGELAVLEGHFLKERKFIGGDKVDIADFAVAPMVKLLGLLDDVPLSQGVQEYLKRFDAATGFGESKMWRQTQGFVLSVLKPADNRKSG